MKPAVRPGAWFQSADRVRDTGATHTRYGGCMRPRLLPLLLLLVGCARPSANDLTSQVLFTASGTFDTQADQRRREGAGVRWVQWTSRPPLDAAAVTVRYDSDQRPHSWLMTVQHPGFKITSLKGEYQARQIAGENASLFTSGPLRDILLLSSTPNKWTLLTRGYAQHHLPQYLPAFITR